MRLRTQMKKYKFLFTGGGTGGHVYPNIAIYEALKEKYPEAEFMYVGSKKGSEAGIVPALEQPMRFVTVPSRGLPQNIRSVGTFFSLAASCWAPSKVFSSCANSGPTSSSAAAATWPRRSSWPRPP